MVERIEKGVILAGGLATRLLPCTKVVNKHLLPVYNKPMIYYSLSTLIKAGIKDILLISSPSHIGSFVELLGSGKEFGIRLSYEIQERPSGIAHALGLAEGFAEKKSIALILGDNILEYNIKKATQSFFKGAKIFLKRVKDPSSFGVAKLEKGKIKKITEKPRHPSSNLAVIGLYLYDKKVWDIIKKLKPSKRGELEITDLNNFYIKKGALSYQIIKGFWADCGGSFDDLLECAKKISKNGLQGKLI